MGERTVNQLRTRLAAIVDSSDDAILSKTLDGTIVSWNPAAERLYGYSAEEIVGKHLSVIVPEERRGEIDHILSTIARGERIRHFESERIAKDGRRVQVSLTISPIYDSEGRIDGASTIARDITEARRITAALEEQAELLDIAQDAIMARSLSGKITYWNSTAEERYGWSKAEALGQNSHELLHTQFPEPLAEIEAELLASGRWDGHLIHTTRDGSEVVDESRWVLRRGPQGQAHQVLEVNNDITRRKRAELDLAERQATLSAILATSPDIIAVVASDLSLEYVNQAAERILGYPVSALLVQEQFEQVDPDHRDMAESLFRTAFGDAGYAEGRVRVKSSAGEWITLDLRLRRMSDSNRVVVVARDASDQARLEKSLLEARDQADRANLAKSEFLSRMSHELRTPLNAILGFAQLLELEDLPPGQQQSVDQIVKGGRRLLELINEVLDIARVESGQMRLSLEPVSIADVVRDCVALIEPLAAGRRIRLRTELAPEVTSSYVQADRQRLGQALLNLLSNAVKYNVEGGLVTVRGQRSDGRIRIGITDTGPGIAPDDLPLLFTPFERLGAEESSVEGTGLGLALSKSLVEAMGGSVTVDTTKGEGTTFWVEVNAAEQVVSDGQELRRSRNDLSPPGHRKVLYIEDNLSNLRLIERLVGRSENIELIPAMTGRLGIDLAREHVPDLVLLDLHLPDLRGDEVLMCLRKDPATRAVPVVMLSADATPGEIKRLRAAGATEYVTKPIDVSGFLTMLAGILDGETAS